MHQWTTVDGGRELVPGNTTALRESYIQLLEQAVTNRLYEASIPPPTREDIERCSRGLADARQRFSSRLEELGRERMSFIDLSPEKYHHILHSMSPGRAVHTMTAPSGVANVVACARDVIERGVPGDFIEAGVWKGGLTILMRGILKAYAELDRRVWVADSFSGLPVPDDRVLEDVIAHHLTKPISFLSVSLEDVKANFERYGLLDEQVCFLEGLFSDSLPGAPIEQLALARLDGDLYESTMTCLVELYPKISIGGYVIIDDYGLPLGCRRAVDEYRSAHGISEMLEWVNEQTVYWRRLR